MSDISKVDLLRKITMSEMRELACIYVKFCELYPEYGNK